MAGRHPLPYEQKRQRIVLYLTPQEWEELKRHVPRVPKVKEAKGKVGGK